MVTTTAVAGWFIVVELPDRLAQRRPAPPAVTQSVVPPQPTASAQKTHQIEYRTFTDPTGLALTGAAAHATSAVRLADGAQRSGAMWSTATLDPAGSFSTAFRFASSGRSGGLSFVLQAEGVASDLALNGLRPRMTVDFTPAENTPAGTVTVSTARTGAPTRLGTAGTGLGPDSGPVTVWIDYSARKHTLRLYLSTSSTKPAKPQLTTVLNLGRTFGKNPVYAGFVATTGDAAGTHEVLAWLLSQAA